MRRARMRARLRLGSGEMVLRKLLRYAWSCDM